MHAAIGDMSEEMSPFPGADGNEIKSIFGIIKALHANGSAMVFFRIVGHRIIVRQNYPRPMGDGLGCYVDMACRGMLLCHIYGFGRTTQIDHRICQGHKTLCPERAQCQWAQNFVPITAPQNFVPITADDCRI
jgi:hypothetical protein